MCSLVVSRTSSCVGVHVILIAIGCTAKQSILHAITEAFQESPTVANEIVEQLEPAYVLENGAVAGKSIQARHT